MLTYWRAGAAALRGPLVVGACILCFVVGALSGGNDVTSAPPVATQPTAAVTDESVRALADALARVTAESVPPTASSVVAEAQDVLDAVDRGEVVVVPSATSTTTSPPTTTTTTTAPTTTTTTTARVRDLIPPVPATVVPPPFTVTVP